MTTDQQQIINRAKELLAQTDHPGIKNMLEMVEDGLFVEQGLSDLAEELDKYYRQEPGS